LTHVSLGTGVLLISEDFFADLLRLTRLALFLAPFATLWHFPVLGGHLRVPLGHLGIIYHILTKIYWLQNKKLIDCISPREKKYAILKCLNLLEMICFGQQ